MSNNDMLRHIPKHAKKYVLSILSFFLSQTRFGHASTLNKQVRDTICYSHLVIEFLFFNFEKIIYLHNTQYEFNVNHIYIHLFMYLTYPAKCSCPRFGKTHVSTFSCPCPISISMLLRLRPVL